MDRSQRIGRWLITALFVTMIVQVIAFAAMVVVGDYSTAELVGAVLLEVWAVAVSSFALAMMWLDE